MIYLPFFDMQIYWWINRPIAAWRESVEVVYFDAPANTDYAQLRTWRQERG